MRELEWFEVETKIRQFVFDLIEPKVEKLMHDRQRIDSFANYVERAEKCMKELESVVKGTNVKMGWY